jgi:hypothetical protein
MMPHPASLGLEKLFVDHNMFASRDNWRSAGFKVNERSDDGKVMVASHEAAKGYLFKKYSDKVSLKEQLDNYERRIEGARRLKALIADERLQHIVVPQKWLYALPRKFSSHVLIVEQLKLLDNDESKSKYRHIDKDVLRELCLVFFKFRGLDSIVANVPFTEDRKIAFIDTEHWNRRRDKWDISKKPYLRHIHLSDDRRKFAKKVFEELADD